MVNSLHLPLTLVSLGLALHDDPFPNSLILFWFGSHFVYIFMTFQLVYSIKYISYKVKKNNNKKNNINKKQSKVHGCSTYIATT